MTTSFTELISFLCKYTSDKNEGQRVQFNFSKCFDIPENTQDFTNTVVENSNENTSDHESEEGFHQTTFGL